MLKELSDEALQAELDRRKAEREAEVKPQPAAKPDWSRVRAAAIDHVECTLRREGKKGDEHYIYERVLETVYGKNIWQTLDPFWK
jgi:hypothetical protein